MLSDLTLKFICIFISCSIFYQSYLIKNRVGTYLFPPAIFSLAWFAFSIFPLLLLISVPVNPAGIVYILICTLFFSLSATPFNWKNAYELNALKGGDILGKLNSNFLRYCLFISIILSVVCALLSASENGFDIREMLFKFMKVSNEYAEKRIGGGLQYTYIGKFATMFIYSSASLGGLLFFAEKKEFYKNLFLLMALLPAVFVMLTQSSKVVLYIAIAYFFASNMLMMVLKNDLNIFNKRFFIRLLSYALIFSIPIVISTISRVNNLLIGVDASKLLFHSFNSYVLGSFFSFSDFFASYLGFPSLLSYVHQDHFWGRYTVKPLFDALGYGADFPVGIYIEQYRVVDVMNTNIFTIFRGLIYDFGVFGSLLAIFISGLIINGVFYRLLCDKDNIFASVFFITSIVFIFFSNLMSLFMARYTLPVFLFVYIALKLNVIYCNKFRTPSLQVDQ